MMLRPVCVEPHANLFIFLCYIGGSAKAAADLVKQLGGEVIGFLFILEIPGLNGREKLGGIETVILLEDA
jgi:adenine/guanine phosphoribosyltransferase-like PRPP-binding protein